MDINDIMRSYIQMWNEPNEDRRDELIANVFAPDAIYEGPLVAACGRDGISRIATELRSNLIGQRLMRNGNVEHHHESFRFRWQLVPGDGDAVFASGVDIGQVDASGQIERITMFLDMAPAVPAAH